MSNWQQRIPVMRYFEIDSWLEWVGFATLLLITLFAMSFYDTDDMRRWLVLFCCIAILILETWSKNSDIHPFSWHFTVGQFEHTRLLLMTLFTLILIVLDVNFTALIILYFIFSARALSIFPHRDGYLWIGLFGIITTGYISWATWPTWQYGFLNGFGATCGYFFMGSAANAQRRAEQASAESQRLLAELQAAHDQLQAHASRAEELAIAQERNRMAREMHDTLGHRLTVAAVQLEGAQKLIARNPDKAAAMVGTVREQVVAGLADLRQTVAALRAPAAEEIPLRTALAELVNQFVDATGIDVALHLPDHLPPLPTPVRQTLYRAAQESLTNIQRHAQADRATVTLALVDAAPNAQAAPVSRQMLLTVEDDGAGRVDALQHGFGLRGLAERTSALAGTLQITQSRALGGLALQVAIPVVQSEQSGEARL